MYFSFFLLTLVYLKRHCFLYHIIVLFFCLSHLTVNTSAEIRQRVIKDNFLTNNLSMSKTKSSSWSCLLSFINYKIQKLQSQSNDSKLVLFKCYYSIIKHVKIYPWLQLVDKFCAWLFVFVSSSDYRPTDICTPHMKI